MRYLYLVLLLAGMPLFAQDYAKNWDKVIRLENDGRIKSAAKAVAKISSKAEKDDNEPQIIKSFFYRSKYRLIIEENAQANIFHDLESRSASLSPPSKALMQFIYAKCLTDYAKKNRYKLQSRPSADSLKTNFDVWNYDDFRKASTMAFDQAVSSADILKNIPIGKYESIFEFGSNDDGTQNLSLYRYLITAYITTLKENLDYYIYEKTPDAKTAQALLGSASEFKDLKLPTFKSADVQRILQLYQEIERPEDAGLTLQRLKFVHERLIHDTDQYLNAIYRLPKTNARTTQEIMLEKAIAYNLKAASAKEGNDYVKIASLLDSIIAMNLRTNLSATAKEMKYKLNLRSIEVKMDNYLYPLQPSIANVTYLNTYSFTVSYFRISQRKRQIFESSTNRDSIIQTIVAGVPLQVRQYSFSNKTDYYSHTASVLLPQVDTGLYFVYFEGKSAEPERKATATAIVNVTQLFPTAKSDAETEIYQILDRKTGSAIRNAKITIGGLGIFTDDAGQTRISRSNSRFQTGPLEISVPGDTIFLKTHRLEADWFRESGTEDLFFAFNKIYTDRAIYRPGQKMQFKIVLIGSRNGIAEVVAQTPFQVIIRDPFRKEIYKTTLTTNEFGSASGEFLLPANGLTGNYTLNIEEPDNIEDLPGYDAENDEHPFWDNAEVNFSAASFRVEEYKRPKFEVVFDPVNQDVLLGSKTNITGHVNSFSGADLADSKVAYSITCPPDSDTKPITGETRIDQSGNFSIPLETADVDRQNEQLPVRNYSFSVTVTDLNGESRSANIGILAGYHSLTAQLGVPFYIRENDIAYFTIRTLNLNDQVKPAKGKIDVYLTAARPNKFVQLQCRNLEGISNAEFQKLFPNGLCQLDDQKDESSLPIRTIAIDTGKKTEYAMDFLKGLAPGTYKIAFTSIDEHGNEITARRTFQYQRKTDKTNGEKLFHITQLNHEPEKDGYVDLKIMSVISDLNVNLVVNQQLNSIYDNRVRLSDGEITVRIKIPAGNHNDLSVNLESLFENFYFTDQIAVVLSRPAEEMSIESESFRSTLEPGTPEKWSFSVKLAKKSASAEILANMYDASLDRLATDKWQKFQSYQYNNYYFTRPTVLADGFTYFGFDNLNQTFERAARLQETTRLLWFGFDINNYSNENSRKDYLRTLSLKSKRPKNANAISGIVSDSSGPVPGANITVKGTNRSTQSDIDGYYEIAAAPGDTLVFSYVGLTDFSAVVSKTKVINAKLENGAELNEVVVTGALGIRRTREAVNLSQQVLTGKISGISISDSDSEQIVLRGNRNLGDKNDALIIIDENIASTGQLSKIPPQDILDMSVLKGPEAVALYGPAAAKGVIVVVTKKGASGLSGIKARQNLAEVAFFFPHITTDSKGRFDISFTSPEAMTSWKFRMMAHMKDASMQYFEKNVLTRKDLIIIPNFPRFVREKDSITLLGKVSNLTASAKTGIAMLRVFDAANASDIDVSLHNSKPTRTIAIKPNGSAIVSWKIAIPEGLQGLQYKVLVKSGSATDGEEGILPVLTNNVLITEAVPLWVKPNVKREFTLSNLDTNTSSTKKNQKLVLEYAANPAWFALGSLPYLIEYEHECAEQTFARFYANALASEVVDSNAKVKSVLKNWENAQSGSPLEEKGNLNPSLLAETPWFAASGSEAAQKVRIATLLEPIKSKAAAEAAFDKLVQKQKSSGGFPWFDGGYENAYITKHILAGLGHLSALGALSEENRNKIANTAIPYIDHTFSATKDWQDIQYLYARSFYIGSFPLPEAIDKKVQAELDKLATNWTSKSLYEKGLAALVFYRFDRKKEALRILESLKETSSTNEKIGMYWIENRPGWQWFQAPIETQALLIEAFAEIDNDKKSVDAMKTWLIKTRQGSHWPTTRATTEAVYAILLQGTDWTNLRGNTTITVGTTKIDIDKSAESEAGYIKKIWNSDKITNTLATVSIDNRSKAPGYGGFYWQYFENLDNIRTTAGTPLSVSKQLYIHTGSSVSALKSGHSLKKGDLVTVRLTVRSEDDLDFIHLKDMRASCFEPADVLSGYRYQDAIGYYYSIRDAATHFFFDKLPKGTHIFQYDVRVSAEGDFTNGVATIESMYAPEFASHTQSTRIKVNQ